MNLYGFDNFGIWIFDLCFNSDKKQKFLCVKYVFSICLIATVEVYFIALMNYFHIMKKSLSQRKIIYYT